VKAPVSTLLILLLVQCAIAAIVYWPNDMLPTMRDKKPLISFNADLLDEINISDRHNNEVVLLRRGEHWILPELEELPADDGMIRDLIDALAYQPHGRPVADTVPARQRFHVAAYHYQRRLTLIGEDELLGTIYLGTSPGFRRVHARNDTGDAIYSVKFNNFDAPASASAWLQRSLLQISDPDHIKGPGFEISRAEEDDQRTLAETEPTLALDVRTASGTERLEYFSLDSGRFIYSRKFPLFFSLSDYDFDRITGIDASILAATIPARSTTDPEENSPQ
jgi:hypothetical protein